MLGYAFRRVLWLVPTLLAVTLLAFALLTSGVTKQEQGGEELARFIELAPRGVHQRATEAVRAISQEARDSTAAVQTLVEMGGAALPHVLPELDALSPEGRTRVALALASVADRMGLKPESEYRDAKTAALFWNRYWQDHAIDFNPAVARRAVRRVAQRPSSLRVAEVRSLDTYALEDLIRAMTPVRTLDDVVRVRRLSSLAARVTDFRPVLPRNATIAMAKSVVEDWRMWWVQHRAFYVPFQGAGRLTAMLRETRYGHWVGALTFGGFAGSIEAKSPQKGATAAFATTAWLVFTGLFLGTLFGISCGVVHVLFGKTVDRLLVYASVAVAGTLVVFAAALVGPSGSLGHRFVGAALATMVQAAVAFLYTQRASAEPSADHLRFTGTYEQSTVRLGVATARISCVAALAGLSTKLPFLIVWAFVIEKLVGIEGIGESVIAASRSGNVQFLMAVVLTTTLVAGLCQIVTDVLLRLVDPRLDEVWRAQEGGGKG